MSVRTKASWAISALLGAAGLAGVVQLIYLQVRYFSFVPNADYWWIIDAVRRFGESPPVSWYWLPHGDHRCPIPKLLYIWDWKGFGASGVSLIVLSVVLQAAHAGVLVFGLRRLSRVTPAMQWSAAGFALVCLFHPMQWENFLTPFQVCFVLAFLASACAITLAALGPRWIPAAIVAALIGSLTLASGLLVWPLLVIEAWALRYRWRYIVLSAVSGAAVFAAYFRGSAPTASAPFRISEWPLYAGFYFDFFNPALSMFGHPWATWLLWIALAGVVAAVAACGWSVWRDFRQPAAVNVSNRDSIWILTLIAYILISAAAIAYGRHASGMAARYMTPGLLFWCYAGVGLVVAASQRGQSVMLGVQAVILGFCLVQIPGLPAIYEQIREHHFDLDRAGTALAGMVNDQDILQPLAARGELSERNIRVLNAKRTTLFRHGPFALIGRKIEVPERVCDGGSITGIRPVFDGDFPGYQIVGTTFDSERDTVVVSGGVAVAVARAGRLNDPRDWIAYAPAAVRGGALQAVSMGGAEPCRLGPPLPVNADATAPLLLTEERRGEWTPVGISQTGQLDLPRFVGVTVPGRGVQSLIVRLEVSEPDFIDLTLPTHERMICWIPQAWHSYYAVFHIGRYRALQGAVDLPLFLGHFGAGHQAKIYGAWQSDRPIPDDERDVFLLEDPK